MDPEITPAPPRVPLASHPQLHRMQSGTHLVKPPQRYEMQNLPSRGDRVQLTDLSGPSSNPAPGRAVPVAPQAKAPRRPTVRRRRTIIIISGTLQIIKFVILLAWLGTYFFILSRKSKLGPATPAYRMAKVIYIGLGGFTVLVCLHLLDFLFGWMSAMIFRKKFGFASKNGNRVPGVKDVPWWIRSIWWFVGWFLVYVLVLLMIAYLG